MQENVTRLIVVLKQRCSVSPGAKNCDILKFLSKILIAHITVYVEGF